MSAYAVNTLMSVRPFKMLLFLSIHKNEGNILQVIQSHYYTYELHMYMPKQYMSKEVNQANVHCDFS